MEVVNPSVMVSRLDLVVLDSAAAGIDFSSTPLGFLEYWGIYRAKRRSGGHPRWVQPTRARLGLLARPGGLWPPRGTPQVQPAHCLPSGPKNSSSSFVAFGLRLILLFSDVKNMGKQQLALGTMSIG